nr:MAG TPA: Protein of unknown function (DUF1180) [Caudoviricetes sp.]
MNELYEFASRVNTLVLFYLIIGLSINGIFYIIKKLVKFIVKKVKSFRLKRKQKK